MLGQQNYAYGDEEDLVPLIGTRQRRLGGGGIGGHDIPYRDDPFRESPKVFLESFPTSNISSLKPQPRYLPSISQRIRHCCNSCCWRTFRSNVARENNQFSNLFNNDDNDDEQNLYYQDDFNDAPWSCRMGTTEEHGIWMNYSDQAGTIMAMLVWILMVYSCLTVTFLARTGGIPVELSMMYSILVTLALASHAKTTLSDPGTIPASAVPTEEQRKHAKLNMCSQCQTFKPPFTHHCRICNRCISRMDHHCPWMNNCIGVANMKHFILFLTYTWICSVYSLALLGWNYFFCSSEDCTFTPVLLQLVRFMTILGIGTFLFTSSMLMNVAYGLMTGIGTIDRLKKKATNTMQASDEEPIPLKDVFGVGPLWTWIFPIDPLFDDYDRVSGYSTPQRLLREQMKLQNQPNDMSYPPSVISQYTPV